MLESLDHALARGAEVCCEITGYGLQMDPDSTRPGSGLKKTMCIALANANLCPRDIDYICAYGPGHPLFDKIELEMIEDVFGESVRSVAISSIKGVTGNALAAGGSLQIIASALIMKHELICPTANCDQLDQDCDLDVVRGRPRRTRVDRILINVRGLGGGNSTLIIQRVAE